MMTVCWSFYGILLNLYEVYVVLCVCFISRYTGQSGFGPESRSSSLYGEYTIQDGAGTVE